MRYKFGKSQRYVLVMENCYSEHIVVECATISTSDFHSERILCMLPFQCHDQDWKCCLPGLFQTRGLHGAWEMGTQLGPLRWAPDSRVGWNPVRKERMNERQVLNLGSLHCNPACYYSATEPTYCFYAARV